ncbi:UDPGT domain-containing protein [Cephalotus follicularis]|uniref:UDPGT domain-containing protein n=1 Tax=Cephalotus follicularis TaxID=3775 RepID=A0A1Q3BMI7_CEPFO|nr:UDPGT domain-containing protein [Cephalotus follicularis]
MQTNKIYVVTGSGQGHLYPCMELCRFLSSRNYHTTLVISSNLSTAIPSSFTENPLHEIAQISPSPRPIPGSAPLSHQSAHELEAHLVTHARVPDLPPPLCAIIDFQMGWTKRVFWKFDIPVIGLFTFGACAAAMEWGAWKVHAGDLKPGETLPVHGLPEEMSLTHSDLLRKSFGQPRGSGGPKPGGGPPKPGDRPPWVPEIQGSIGLMFNTCDYIDRPFIEYMADQMGMPAWGVGPLLPQQYWNSSGSLIRNRERQSNFTEDEIIQWLDSKPRGSVLYVAFGSEVGPTMEEHQQLACALEELDRPFVWVIQPGSGGLDKKVGDRGLIICGWAPQLLILSHKSTGGFLSHCGWNSTMEAIGRGIPFLAWPIRGDQYFNAKLVVSYHKVGYRVAHDLSLLITKDDIFKGVERLMGDIQMKRRAEALSAQFEHGFPATSVAALDAFEDFISQKQKPV